MEIKEKQIFQHHNRQFNVTPLGSDSPVKSSGGSGDVKIVQDISVAVSAIAESMKSGTCIKR